MAKASPGEFHRNYKGMAIKARNLKEYNTAKARIDAYLTGKEPVQFAYTKESLADTPIEKKANADRD